MTTLNRDQIVQQRAQYALAHEKITVREKTADASLQQGLKSSTNANGEAPQRHFGMKP